MHIINVKLQSLPSLYTRSDLLLSQSLSLAMIFCHISFFYAAFSWLVHTFPFVKIETKESGAQNYHMEIVVWMLGRIDVGIVFHVLLITLTRAWLQQLPQLLDAFFLLCPSFFLSFSQFLFFWKFTKAQRRHYVAMCSVCSMWLKSVECERYRSNWKCERTRRGRGQTVL